MNKITGIIKYTNFNNEKRANLSKYNFRENDFGRNFYVQGAHSTAGMFPSRTISAEIPLGLESSQ